MNYSLNSYTNRLKGNCLILGFSLNTTKTPRQNMVLLSSNDSRRVVLATYQSNIFGEARVFTYLVNRKKYEWAREEGFSLDQMLELEAEKVFIEIDPSKVAEYLL